MKNFTKRIIAMSAAIIVTGGIAITSATAAPKNTQNNVGNSCKYKDSIDISLAWNCIDSGLGKIYTDHTVKYSKPEVTMHPYNDYSKITKVVYYAEWKEGSVTKDKLTYTYTLANDKRVYRDLSKGMKLTTWDSDITYFRVDNYPYKGNSSEDDVLKEHYNRRASTAITH